MAEIQHEFEISKMWGLWRDRSSNPLTRYPQRFWSQSDEDGIVDQILNRINLEDKTFIEFGCGNGLENNTLALISKGWKGGWIDGKSLSYDLPALNTKLKFQQKWVTKENIVSLYDNALPGSSSNLNHVGLLSLDLDGNDYHFIEEILNAGKSSDIVVLEYNARFPVGSEWVMPYDPKHVWTGGDYFGASLTSFTNLLQKFNYKLVACSIQGSNAFFINEAHLDAFKDINFSIDELYQPPLYYLIPHWGQELCPKTVLSLLKE